MTYFINPEYKNWYPKPGDKVKGKYGKHWLEGFVLADKKNPTKPRIFSRYGCVLCYCEILYENLGRKEVAMNQLEPLRNWRN